MAYLKISKNYASIEQKKRFFNRTENLASFVLLSLAVFPTVLALYLKGLIIKRFEIFLQ